MGSVDVHLGLVYWAVWAELASQLFVCVGFFSRPFKPLPGAQEWPRPRGSHDSWRRGATLATHTILSPPPPGAGFDSGGSWSRRLPPEPELQHTSSERNGERGLLEVLRPSPPAEPRRSPLLPASVLLPPLPFAMGPAPPGDPRLRRAAGLRGAEDGAF